MMPTEPRSIHPQRVHSVIIPINLPSLARAERTRVPRKNSPSDHASACIRRARSNRPWRIASSGFDNQPDLLSVILTSSRTVHERSGASIARC